MSIVTLDSNLPSADPHMLLLKSVAFAESLSEICHLMVRNVGFGGPDLLIKT